MHDYLTETKMLDYSNENIKQLIRERKWSDMAEFERLKAIYTFVRDEILFGYNVDDSVPASRVLRDRKSTRLNSSHPSSSRMPSSA